MIDPVPAPVYEYADALAFAVQWTGLPSGDVDAILRAKERYLFLAGLADDPDDPTIPEERARHADLMPETPDFIDERALEYVCRVTGLDRGIVERVDGADLAYQESLGVVTWNDEEERDIRLGGPVLDPESDPDWGLPPLREGHGDHWAGILPDLKEGLPYLLQGLEPASLLFFCPSPASAWSRIALLGLPQGPGASTLYLVGDGDERQAELLSAFPALLDGSALPLRMGPIRGYASGLEAIAQGETRWGMLLSFFDVGYLHPGSTWTDGEIADVALAGLATFLERAPDQVLTIDREETVRILRATSEGCAPEEVTDLSPVDVHTRGMACLVPASQGNPDEYEFQGTVNKVDVMAAWGRTLYRMEVRVFRGGSGPGDISHDLAIWAAAHVLPEGYRPRPGDDVRGRLWLQGCRASLAPSLTGRG